MTGVYVGWRQTAKERYQTDINLRAHALIKLAGHISEYEGGCHADPSIKLPGEEHYMLDHVVAADLPLLRVALSRLLGNPETLVIETEGAPGIQIA